MEDIKQFLNTELGKTIFNNKYRASNETFDGWIERVSGGYEAIGELIKNKKFLFAGRTLSNRGMNSGSLSNCFDANTKVITNIGVVSLYELYSNNTPFKTLSRDGSFKDATCKHFGKQEIVELIVEKDGVDKIINTTSNHIWFALEEKDRKKSDKYNMVCTSDLKEGMYLQSVTSKCYKTYKPSPFGVAHGAFYGDGDHSGDYRKMNFCGKKKQLIKYFMPDKVSKSNNSDSICSVPKFMHEKPSLSESKSYIYGFLAGYFATDGSMSKNGSCSISSSKKEDIELVKNLLGVLGISYGHEKEQYRKSNLTNEYSTIYSIVINKRYLNKSFFVRKDHALLFDSLSNDRNSSRFRVKSIRSTGRVEDVYCLVVPETECFALDGNILTHNCYSNGYAPDSLKGILEANKELGLTYKAQGGNGISLSMIRPKGASVAGRFTSDGIVPFMKLFDTTTSIVSQAGSRKGALMMSLDIWHPEAKVFIKIKEDFNAITKANLSLEVDDMFMECVSNNITSVDRVMEGPGWRYEYTVNPVELFNMIATSSWKSAEPGVLFVNKMRSYNIMQHHKHYKIITTNPCQPSWATILTKDGLKTMGDISIGDYIWSMEGWTKVVNKWSTGVKDVYRFRTSSGEFVGTKNHRIVSKSTKIEVGQADSIDSLAGKYSSDISFNGLDIMDGLMIGDGSRYNRNKSSYLCIGKNDHDYFNCDLIKDLIIKNRPGIKHYAYDVKCTISPDELDPTYDRSIPDRFVYGDRSKIASFLRGLYSANGSVVDKRVSLKTSSKSIRDKVQLMLSSIGIRSYYTRNKPSDTEFKNGIYKCKESYDVNISSDRDLFYNIIGFIQEYKMDKLKKTLSCDLKKGLKTNRILYSEYVSTEEVFDITVDNASHTYWTGGLNVSNCAEQCLPKYGACNLSSINISEYVKHPFTDDAYIDYLSLSADINHIVRAMDDVLDENSRFHALDEQRRLAEDYRNIGIGIMGFADSLIKMKIVYGSKGAIDFTSELMRFIFRESVISSSLLAEERGVFNGYDECVFDSDIMNTAFSKAEIENLKFRGLRNCSLVSIAPTGSIGTMLNISTGIEPIFALKYTRKTESLVNGEDCFFDVFPGIVEEYMKMTGCKFEDLPEYFISSDKINPISRVAMQGAAQRFTDAAISSTINLPESTTVDEIKDIFKQSWLHGLKGVTIYRDGSRAPILDRGGSKKDEVIETKKRPRSISAKFHRVTNKGIEYDIFVGLINDRPYEIFCQKAAGSIMFDPKEEYVITKEAKNSYFFSHKNGGIKIVLQENSDEERAHAILISMLLRHNIELPFIIKTAKKINSSISSFSSAICRILSMYITEIKHTECPECGGDMIMTGGCNECKNCGYSKCGG